MKPLLQPGLMDTMPGLMDWWIGGLVGGKPDQRHTAIAIHSGWGMGWDPARPLQVLSIGNRQSTNSPIH